MSRHVVLVVDDSPDIRRIVVRALLQENCQCIEADNGITAVQLARRHRPDLIIVDINIPGIDGLEVVCQLRADPAFEDVPMIAMTAYAVTSAADMARSAGCQRVFFKPFNIDTLAQEVRTLLAAQLTLLPNMAYQNDSMALYRMS